MAEKTISRVNVVMQAYTAGLEKGLARAKSKTTAFQRQMIALKGTMLAMFGVGAAMSVMRGAVNTIADFDQAMANLDAITKPTVRELEDLRESAKDLGRSTRYTSGEVAGLQTELGKLGFTAKEIIAAQSAILSLAAATNSDLAEAAAVAGTTLRQFGLDAVKTQRVVDVMAKSFTISALDMNKFTESMKYVGPIASAAGISLEETTAMIAALANAGIDGSMAGTGLKMIINKLTTDSKPLAEKLKQLADEGLSFADANDEVGLRAQAALLVLSKGIPQIDGFKTALEGAGGAAQEMATKQMDTLKGKTLELTSAWQGLMIEMGGEGFGPVKSSISGLSRVLNAITDSIKAWKDAFAASKAAYPTFFTRDYGLSEAMNDPNVKPLEPVVKVDPKTLSSMSGLVGSFSYLNKEVEKFEEFKMEGMVTLSETVKEIAKPMEKLAKEIFPWMNFEIKDVTDALSTMGNEALALRDDLDSMMSQVLEDEEFLQDDTWTEALTARLESIKQFSEDVKSSLQDMMTSVIISISEGLGKALAGVDGGLGNVLAKIGEGLSQLGKMFIAYGVALLAFWAAFSLGPAGAIGLIAAGAALVIAGTAIATKANSMADGTSSATGSYSIQPQTVNVQGTISNDTIRISNKRGSIATNSYNGLRYG